MAMFDDDSETRPQDDKMSKKKAKKAKLKEQKKMAKITAKEDEKAKAQEDSIPLAPVVEKSLKPAKQEPIVIEDPSVSMGKSVSFHYNLKSKKNSFLVRDVMNTIQVIS